MRFELTHEFDNFTVEDWLDNAAWFDIKLLVDAGRGDTDRTEPMSNDTYSKAMKDLLAKLGIPSNHWVHLGRVVGPRILEMLEVESEDIRKLGNWDPTIQETCYSTHIPLAPMRRMAGFTSANGMHYNPRTTVKPPPELILQTPFGFAVSMELLQANEEDYQKKYTAIAFLRFLNDLAVILLQDAAAMMVRHPERREHPVYSLDCFHSAEFAVGHLIRMQIWSPSLSNPSLSFPFPIVMNRPTWNRWKPS